MKTSTAHPWIALSAMLLVLAVSLGLDRAIYTMRVLVSQTAMYMDVILWLYSLSYLLQAVMLLGLFSWIRRNAAAVRWAAWAFLLVGLVICLYPVLYFTPVWGWLLGAPMPLADWFAPRTLVVSSGAFIAVIGAAALLRRRQPA